MRIPCNHILSREILAVVPVYFLPVLSLTVFITVGDDVAGATTFEGGLKISNMSGTGDKDVYSFVPYRSPSQSLAVSGNSCDTQSVGRSRRQLFS